MEWFPHPALSRRALFAALAAILVPTILACTDVAAQAQEDPLPSWNNGTPKQAIVDFVWATSSEGSPTFVPQAERIATFDQDGTLWVEHPMTSQMIYCLDRVPALVAAKPELKDVKSFRCPGKYSK